MDAIDHTLLAIEAAHEDPDAAHAHLRAAADQARTTARRHRQVVEIAALVVADCRGRAAGLAAEHVREFPDDADLLTRVTGEPPCAGATNL